MLGEAREAGSGHDRWRVQPRVVGTAGADDMPAITDIVNDHIMRGVAHFADQPQRVEDWTAAWVASRSHLPWLVAERDDVVCGVAYAKRFNPRAAYDWTAEVSIYLREGLQGQGLGSLLYRRLLQILDAQGYRCLVAGITLPTDASVALHESYGFEYLGTLTRVGYKHGAWRDVGSWLRHVGPTDDSEPLPVRSVDDVLAGQ